MRLKLLSPGEMNVEQKETYDESIAGKRGAPPAPMMAWLNSPQMARHATRLGEQLRFNTMFPAKLSEIATPATGLLSRMNSTGFAYGVIAISLRQRRLAAATMGRANAALQAAGTGLLLIAALGAGELAEQVGLRTTMWIGLATGGLAVLPLLRLPSSPPP